MLSISNAEALNNRKINPRRNWNSGAGTDVVSDDKNDASHRIFNDYALVATDYDGPKLKLSDPIFAMGSCFAREIEAALIERGGNVISIDSTLDCRAFDTGGRPRSSFFHRFTPMAMLQEFQQAFGEAPGWSQDALLFERPGGEVLDLNYGHVGGADYSREAVMERRRIATALVRRAAEAKAIVLTLGLIEGWVHVPSGLHANAPNAKLLARKEGDFELRVAEVADAVECLEEILALLVRHHKTGDFQLVVTVSPVPLSATFLRKDIIVANAESKAVLRAAAGQFSNRHEKVHYFPSYEIVMYTAPDLAWRPDRIHVQGRAVRRVVKIFMAGYYERASLQRQAAHVAAHAAAIATA